MKRSFIIAAILIAWNFKLLAQPSGETGTATNNKFINAMEANLKILDTAGNSATLIMLANNFERIGKAEQKQWQPYYHAAFCYSVMALNTPDKSGADQLADKAESYLALADALNKNNSEINTLKAMIIYARILVDPPGRWQAMSK